MAKIILPGASGDFSVALGLQTYSTGKASTTEGNYTTASGDYSHAEGHSTMASGYASHAEGYYTTAQNKAQHSSGIYNTGTSTTTIYEVGIGTTGLNRKNAFEIHTDGRLIAPELTPVLINTLRSLITKEYLLSADFGNSLPIADPGTAGQLWNNNGVVSVSKGGTPV